jgi:hypothetical protein
MIVTSKKMSKMSIYEIQIVQMYIDLLVYRKHDI